MVNFFQRNMKNNFLSIILRKRLKKNSDGGKDEGGTNIFTHLLKEV